MNAALLVALTASLLTHGAVLLTRRHRRAAAPVRVGIDLVEVETVAATLRSDLVDRYLARVYTDQEVRDCTGQGGVDAARLAGRFAAKEAAMKALGVGGHAIPWRSIEVCRGDDGRPSLLLRGAAAALARDVGVSKLAVSLSHERDYASAMVVASA